MGTSSRIAADGSRRRQKASVRNIAPGVRLGDEDQGRTSAFRFDAFGSGTDVDWHVGQK